MQNDQGLHATFSSVDENKIKICFVMIDGIGEVNIEELGKKTALQSAQTPNMDRLAGKRIIKSSIY